MDNKKTEELLKVLEVIQNQTEKEEAIKAAMLDILDSEGLEDDDIPQNFDLGVVIKILMKDEKDIFSTVQKLDLDSMKIGDYICFKVDDDTTGTEDIYFISSTETLYLESGCLDTF